MPIDSTNENSKEKTKSNLQFLLSHNDIVPLLIQINSNTNKNLKGFKKCGNFGHENFIKNKSYVTNVNATNINNTTTTNTHNLNLNHTKFKSNSNTKRQENNNTTNTTTTEQDLLLDEEYDLFKIEEQPDNLQNGELKEYQLEALNWMYKLYKLNINGILADEMGLGKTIQTISLIAMIEKTKLVSEIFNYIIIVPKVTLRNWQREITKWLPSANILVFYGDKDERKKIVDTKLHKIQDYQILLTTYEVAMKERHSLSKMQFEYLFIDEAHRIKNEKSRLSTDLRTFRTKHRLLITGTPLQNNLHELWSLLNFLMPNIFNSSAEFDELFDLDNSDEENQRKIINQMHKLLKPFMLRRLKSEVQFKIPPKKEIYLYVNLSAMQKGLYKQILTKNLDTVNGVNNDRIGLLNILMQLKKVCNHPYLFPKMETGPPYIDGEHIVYNSMKLSVLDVLLQKIYKENGKVLIFSQMTTMLNIIDDYCRLRGYKYCRIDGSTSTDDRDLAIESFQHPDSEIFIFLLSTRAGGLGINLHAANSVIIYDSDWNPQVDLQAIDRAHRIGQIKQVTIYRFVTEGTVEEKIVERAAKKLKIDHLIIQKGKNIQNKVSALEMTNMIQYGADKIFTNRNSSDLANNILNILKYSEDKTEKMLGKVKSLEEKLSINNLSLASDSKDIYNFEGENFKKYLQINSESFVNFSNSIGQRERKMLGSNNENQTHTVKAVRKPKAVLTGWRAKANGGYDFQFYPIEELEYLDLKEKSWNDYLKSIENEENKEKENKENKDNNNCDKFELHINEGSHIMEVEKEIVEIAKSEEIDNPNKRKTRSNKKAKNNNNTNAVNLINNKNKSNIQPSIPKEFSQEDEEYRNSLIKLGFSKWNKKDFSRFIKALDDYSIKDYEGISKELKTKTKDEVTEYAILFEKNMMLLKGGPRFKAKIDKYNAELNRIIEYQTTLQIIFEEMTKNSDQVFSFKELAMEELNKYDDLVVMEKEVKNVNGNVDNDNGMEKESSSNYITKIPIKNPPISTPSSFIPYHMTSVKVDTSNFTPVEDKYLLCLLCKYGYNNWTYIKNHIMWDPVMKFNLIMKIK